MGAGVQGPDQSAEHGFSLVELLVVVVIISLLAAIAVPVFITQRERAYVAQSETSLKNASTAMEAAAIENEGVYSGITVEDLIRDEGLKYSRSVVIMTIESANEQGYCISVLHRYSGDTYYWDSADGRPSNENCRDAYR